MTPQELAERLAQEFPEWNDTQAMNAAQSVYRASKEIEAELSAERDRPAVSMLERSLSTRVLELERELALKDEVLRAVRSMLDAAYGSNDDHSRSAW